MSFAWSLCLVRPSAVQRRRGDRLRYLGTSHARSSISQNDPEDPAPATREEAADNSFHIANQ